MASEETKREDCKYAVPWTTTVIESDIASVANFRDFQVPFYELKLKVDFDAQVMSGTAALRVAANPDTSAAVAGELFLDAMELNITGVKDDAGADLAFRIEDFAGFGKKLVVDTSSWNARAESVSREFEVTITYSVGNTSAAVCWLKPEQTAAKTHPYLFTQGQACLNRQFFPCQDTPAIKTTYRAVIAVPKGFTPVMAATMLNTVDESGKMVGETMAEFEGLECFRFEMRQPIPSYLVALAVGDLRCAEIGPRSRVWSEPCTIEAAQKEFAGITEKYIAAGEKLFGAYHWDVYDLLVMPPCFPYGGMENPRLTFVTPCLLAGDQSLGDVVAHEIAHSWFGNLVTNASWKEFFLNEGFTMYAQRRITTIVHGEAFTALEADIGITLLKEEMDAAGHDSPFTKLHTPLDEGVDPDDTYNQTPYEKGYCFLSYLRSLVPSDEVFDAFMRDWCQGHKFQSVTAEMMIEFFLSKFPDLRETLTTVEPTVETWLHTPGWPKFVPDLSAAAEMMDPATNLLAKWQSEDAAVRAEAEATDISTLHIYSQMYMLDKMVELEKGALAGGADTLAKMDELYAYGSSQNAELSLRWSQLVIKQDWTPGFKAVRAFLESQGKIRYTVPVYRMLINGSEAAQKLAAETFEATKPALHLSVVGILDRVFAGKK